MSLESETERISKNMARALAEIDRLRAVLNDALRRERVRIASQDRLLAAAKDVTAHCDAFDGHVEATQYDALEAAIAAAEEIAP
jgi:hypothetical protein